MQVFYVKSLFFHKNITNLVAILLFLQNIAYSAKKYTESEQLPCFNALNLNL